MALPSSGPLSISMIKAAVPGGSTVNSLAALNSMVGRNTPPYTISSFYGYNPVTYFTVGWNFYPGVDYNQLVIFNYSTGTYAAWQDYNGPGYVGGSFQAAPGNLIGVSLFADGYYNYSVGTSSTAYELPSYNTLMSYSTNDYPYTSGFGQFYMPANDVLLFASTYATS